MFFVPMFCIYKIFSTKKLLTIVIVSNTPIPPIPIPIFKKQVQSMLYYCISKARTKVSKNMQNLH